MKKIISMFLILTTLFTLCAVTASAAREEEFLSDVALVYEDSVEEARAAIEGTDWKLFEQDLNPKADYMFDDGVYLIYKTSTDVEDAITDLRVMDMYGGFSISNYEKQLEASRAAYMNMIKNIRTAAAEFKAAYEAGDEMAKLAYRQMNYYKDMKTEGGTETDMLMGDFLLNMPTEDKKVVQVLFEGNATVINNLVALLTIGISGDDAADTLSAKVAELYAIKDTLTDEDYHDAAKSFGTTLASIRAKLLRYDALAAEHTLDDEDITEEEFVFMSEYVSLAVFMEEIKLGETNLADLVRKGEYDLKELYPVVAAFSAGQKALIEFGQLETVLKYNAPSKPIAELNQLLDETEKDLKDENGNIKPIDVYIGVDRSIFKGSFAFTDAADRQQALTGETWDMGKALTDTRALDIASYTVAGLAVLAAGMALKNVVFGAVKKLLYVLAKSAIAENAYYHAAHVNFEAAGAFGIVAVAAILIAVGIKSIAVWYNYYNPDYTEIPNTMIDVRETDIGDKYVKYSAAKVFGEEEKNADFNAYEGKEWIALYYTKDATAGNCLTPKFVHSDNDSTIARRHQGISMFGETEAFNLNSHVYSKNAPGVYVTMRYSTTEKAAADMPSVVGSMFATGALYTLTAIGGAGVGIGGTVLIQKARKKKEKPADTNSEE